VRLQPQSPTQKTNDRCEGRGGVEAELALREVWCGADGAEVDCYYIGSLAEENKKGLEYSLSGRIGGRKHG